MAKGNLIYQQGFIINVDDQRKEQGVLFVTLQVNKPKLSLGKHDEPVIIVDRELHMEEIISLWEGRGDKKVLLHVRGHIESYMPKVDISCGNCQELSERSIGRTLIRARYSKPFYGGDDVPHMNVVHLIGFVSKEPILQNTKGISRTSFKLALPMYKGHNYYTQVVTFGEQAEKDAARLKYGELCAVTGHYQVRDITLKHNCPHCGVIQALPIITTEVMGAHVEYLSLFTQNEQEEDETEEEVYA